jgi:hypothetical protein
MNSSAPSSGREIFAEALDLPVEQRAAFLDYAYSGGSARRAQLETLLSAHERAREFLAASPRPQEPPEAALRRC